MDFKNFSYEKKPTIKESNINLNLGFNYSKQWAYRHIEGLGFTSVNKNDNIFKYRDYEKGVFDNKLYKDTFDPVGVEDKHKRQSKPVFKNTDFKHSRLLKSITNTLRENIREVPQDIEIKSQDILSLNKKIKEKFAMLGRQNAIDVLNKINQDSGLLPIDKDADLEEMYGDKKNKANSIESNIGSFIKKEMKDNNSVMLFELSGGNKDGVEMCHEMTSKYWLDALKYKDNISDKLTQDIINANVMCYRFYTDLNTGLPEIQYLDPTTVQTNPFEDKYGKDVTHWRHEFMCTFKEYLGFVGQKLTVEENKEIYKLAGLKNENLENVQNWGDFYNGNFNGKITIGYLEVIVQEYSKSDEIRYYNKTKTIYYLPNVTGENKIIYIGDLQDQFRYGQNEMYSATSLVVCRVMESESMMDILFPDFEKINVLYVEYLNTISTYMPRGTGFAIEAFEQIAEMYLEDMEERDDDSAAEAKNMIIHKLLKATQSRGAGVFATTTKKDGDLNTTALPTPVFTIPNNSLSSASELLNQIFQLFNLMLMNGGISQSRLGNDPQPRQTLTGIKYARESSMDATKWMQRLYNEGITQFVERIMYWNRNVIQEFAKNLEAKTERAKVLQSLVGNYGISLLELYNDMPNQYCTMQVSNIDKSQYKDFITQTCLQYEQQGIVDFGTFITLNKIDNVNLMGMYLLACTIRKKNEVIENQMAMNTNNAQAAQQQMQLQMEMSNKNKELEARIEFEVKKALAEQKTEAQLKIKDKIKDNRIEQEVAIKQINKEEKTFLV